MLNNDYFNRSITMQDLTNAILNYESDTFSATDNQLSFGTARRMTAYLVRKMVLEQLGERIDGSVLDSALWAVQEADMNESMEIYSDIKDTWSDTFEKLADN